MGGGGRQLRLRPFQRQQLIADKVRAGDKGKKKMTIAQPVQATAEPATQDLRGDRGCRPLSSDRQAEDGKLKSALKTLKTWQRRCPPPRPRPQRERRGNAGDPADGRLVADPAAAPSSNRRSASTPTKSSQEMLETATHTGGSPDRPSFDDGWWGYVSKDLRDVLGPKPKGAWSRKYCGGGSQEAVPGRSCGRR